MVSPAQAPALTMQLYTEDRRDAERECATLKELVRGLLTHLEPALKTNHIEIFPLHNVPQRRVSGTYWKAKAKANKSAQDNRRLILQDIVTALRRGHIVVFHVDGDDKYLQDGTHAEVWRHLERLRTDIRRLLGDPRGQASSRETVLEHVFLPVVPFYSIESWAYANTTLLREQLTDPRDLEWLDRWTAAPGAREDTLQIKDRTLSIRDDLNEELVRVNRGFPREDLVKLKRSYADTRQRFADSPHLRAGLAESAARPY